MSAQQLSAGRGGFTTRGPRGQPVRGDPPRLRPMHGPVLAAAAEPVMGDPTTVPEDASIGYGQPADDGEPEPLRITSIQIFPLVAIEATDEGGNLVELTATLDVFVPFAQQVLAMNAAMPYYEEPQREAG